MLGHNPETEVLRQLYASAAATGANPWLPFLDALAGLTRARGVHLRIEAAGTRDFATGRPAELPPAETLRRLRSDRVYAQDELGAAQPLRLIRVSPRPEVQAWLALAHPQRDFRAVDGAQLDRLSPHLTQAVTTWLALARERAGGRATAQQSAALGAGWLWLDPAGRIVEADAPARALLADLPGIQAAPSGRLDLGDPLLARALRAALTRAIGGDDGAQVLTLARQPLTQLLLQPGLAAPAPGLEPVIAAAIRRAPAAAALPLAPLTQALDLNRSEARLAVLLCDGFTLADAAERLGWTPETVRSASKRIFARTGTRGQSDLIRRMLGGAEWFLPG